MGAASSLAAGRKSEPHMRELLRSNDPVLISFARALLAEAGIEHLLVDAHMSVLEGSLGVLPRRVLVLEDDLPRARTLLQQSGIAVEPDRGA
jgi:hypothetical protein